MPWPTGKPAHNRIRPPAPGMRTCKVCGEVKDEKAGFYGKSHKCRVCTIEHNRQNQDRDKTKNWELKRGYGISLEEYRELVESQGGGCAICKSPPPVNQRKKYLVVDHDHKTGKVRGILCDSCNRAIGLLGDNISTLEQAILYLKDNS